MEELKMNEDLYTDYKDAYNEAVSAIVRLRETAKVLRDSLEEIISSCENIEENF